MVLAGLGLNPAGVSLFRMHAPQSPLTRNWLPLEAWILAFFGPWSWWLHHLLFVVALHHLSVSLGRQNATLGTFTGDGFGRFGLESCWGFPVSDACPTEPFDEELASAWGLNPRVLRALILVVASSFVCGCIASSFCQTNKKTETRMDDSLTSSSNLPGSAAWAVALQFDVHIRQVLPVRRRKLGIKTSSAEKK